MRHYGIASAVALGLVLACSALADVNYDRKLKYSVDLAIVPDLETVAWYQRESVTLDFTVTRDSKRVDLTATNYLTVWEVTSRTNVLAAYVVKTGTVAYVVNGTTTNQVLRYYLTPQESNLSSTKYDGWVRLFEINGTNLSYQGVIHRQIVDVRRSPPSEAYGFAGPVWWDRYDPSFLNVDEVSVYRLNVSQIDWNGTVLTAFPTNWPIYAAYNYDNSGAGYTNPSVAVLRNHGGGPLWYFNRIAGADGISIFETNGTIVLSGSATQSVNSLFPIQSSGSRVYYRGGASPHAMTYLAADGAQSGYLFMTSTGLQMQVGMEATNAALFAGHAPAYYQNFGGQTNFQQWDDGVIAYPPASSFGGFEWGNSVDVEFVPRTNGTTTSIVARVNFAGSSTNHSDLLGRSNRWTEANTFEDDTRVEGRLITSDNNNEMSGNYASGTIGGTNVRATGAYSTAPGGRNVYAPGEGSFAVGYGVNVLGAYSAGFGNNINVIGQQSLGWGGFANYVRDFGYIFGGEYTTLYGQYTWGMGRMIYIPHNHNYGFGKGQAVTNPVTSTRDYAFWIDSNDTNLWFFGVNATGPSRTGVVFEAAGGDSVLGTSYVQAVVFPDGTTQLTASAGSGGGGGSTGVFAGVGTTGAITSASGDAGKFLKADGTWDAPSVGATAETSTLAQVASRGGLLDLWWASTLPAQAITGTIPPSVVSNSGIATGTPIYADALSPYITGSESSNRFYLASNPSGYINSAQGAAMAAAGNATSLQGRAVSASAPSAQAALIWNGTEWAPSASPVASSSSSVASVNSGIGHASIIGSGSVEVVTYYESGNTNPTVVIKAPLIESNVYRHIASYTYTGGETSVTFDFEPYCRVDLDMAGQFSPTNTAGVAPVLGVQINGHPWVYRTDMKYDTSADAHPNTVYSYLSSYPGSSNLFVLGEVSMRNANVAYARGMTAARWSFMSSARGIHMEGRGHMSYGFNFAGDYTFDSFGSLQTNDYVNNNAITQLVVICMNLTNGQYLVSSQSNATFRLRGVRCD